MNKIIITGATGFVGANLTRSLLQKNEINIFTRKESNLWRIKDILPELNVHQFDIGKYESLKQNIKKIKPDFLYHLAAYGGYPFQQDIEKIINNNILNTVNILKALAEYGQIVKFVNFGSSSEYGPKSKPMKETDVLEPIFPYGISKVAQTQFTKYFSKKHDIPTVTLRLFSVYGPYEEHGRLIYDIMTTIILGKRLQLGSPYPRRDFIYISDVLTAIKKASELNDVNGEVFNIGGGRDYSILDVLKIVCDATNKTINVSWGNKKKERQFDTSLNWIADLTKSKKKLHWEPTISLKSGLLSTYEWYKKNIKIYET